MAYLAPTALPEAFAGLARPGCTVIAGGTDWFPAQGMRPVGGPMLDVSRLPGFRGIAKTAQGWRIGAATTWAGVRDADLPPAFDGLRLAAREVGSVQIQNAGTVAGNLCNASPAADGVPPLLVLDAAVELISAQGTRVLPLADFILGPRRTALAPGELVSAILVPESAGHSTFLKTGARKYMVISIAMLALWAQIDDGHIADIRLAAGSCGPVARRLATAEARLRGAALAALPPVTVADLPEITPIDDHRASAGYRRAAVAEMIPRALAAPGAA